MAGALLPAGSFLSAQDTAHPFQPMDVLGMEVAADSEIYRVDVETGEMTQVTDRYGPHGGPQPSPDRRLIAYTGYDDEYLGYHPNQLYVMNSDGSGSQMISGDFDRSAGEIAWAADGSGLFF